MGRAANYLYPASEKGRTEALSPEVKDMEAVFAYVLAGKPLPTESKAKLPGLRKARFIYPQ